MIETSALGGDGTGMLSNGTEEETTYSTMVGACLAIVRCMVGPAALYMPHGFAEAGLGGGIALVLCATFLFFLGISRLLACWRAYAGTRDAATVASLAQHLGGRWCRMLVQFSIVSLQAGVCITYFIFVAETLRDVWQRIGARSHPPSMPLVIGVMIVVEASAATVRTVQRLTTANFIGNCLVTISLGIITLYACARLWERGPDERWRAKTTISSTAVFAGTAVFAFEGGASIIVPVANSVSPANRDKVQTATFCCVLGVAVVYTIFASLVYVAYGPDVEVIASRVLGGSSFWPDGAVNLVYLAVALVTFPLQLLPASQILFGDDQHVTLDYHRAPTAADKDAASIAAERRARLKGDALRVGLVVVLGMLALFGRHSLDHLIALLGALSCAPLALVVGPWCHLAIAASKHQRRLDLAIIGCGVLLTTLTLALTLASWRKSRS